jgi:hypothetical protein
LELVDAYYSLRKQYEVQAKDISEVRGQYMKVLDVLQKKSGGKLTTYESYVSFLESLAPQSPEQKPTVEEK